MSLGRYRETLGAAAELFAAVVANNLLLKWQPGPDEIWSEPLKSYVAAAMAVAFVVILRGHVFAPPVVVVEWRDKNGLIDSEILNVPRKTARPILHLTVRRRSFLSRLVLTGLNEIPLSLTIEPRGSYLIEVDTSTPDGHMSDDPSEALLVRMPCAVDGQRLEATLIVQRPASSRPPVPSDMNWSFAGAPWWTRWFVRVQSGVRRVH